MGLHEVQLIFDTGMDRFLTLSQADGYTRRMHWGAPQPETIRDYRLECEVETAWREVLSIRGNYQRRRVHILPARIETRALRLQAIATNGIDHARIFEIRAHG